MAEPLKSWELETLAFAPLSAYSALTRATGAANPNQFRRLRELLEAGDASVEAGAAGRAALADLRANIEARFADFETLDVDPKKGLERTRKVLRRLPDEEREAFARWLVELAIRIAEASRTLGEAAIDDAEVHAIRDIAKWLGAPAPDLGPR